jgi:hypothetical protein
MHCLYKGRIQIQKKIRQKREERREEGNREERAES